MSKVDVERSKLDKTKGVVKKYWKPFTVGVIFTVATVVVAKRVFGTSVSLPTYMEDAAITRLGRPSNMIMDLTTGDMWGSQGATARARGFSDSTLSKHLTRKTSDIHGHRYAVIGRLFI
jgi:hypothetical protein